MQYFSCEKLNQMVIIFNKNGSLFGFFFKTTISPKPRPADEVKHTILTLESLKRVGALQHSEKR